MSNRAWHSEEKRGSKKRKIMKRGKLPKKARIAEKNKRRSFKQKYENLENREKKENYKS